MALIDNESFEGNEIETEEQIQETPREEQTQVSDSVLDKIIPDKYKNKSLEDIVKMHQEAEKMIGKQAQEVHEVRSLADQLLKRQLEEDNKPVVESAPEVDFFENPQDSIKRAIENNPAVLEAKQANLEFKRMKTAQQLSAKHPDMQTVVQDTGFQEWVKASQVRMGLYAKADAEFDFSAADELLSTYKELKQVRNNNVQETGGSKDATLVSHNHTFSGSTDGVGDHAHTIPYGTSGASGTEMVNGDADNNNYIGTKPTNAAGAHSHTYSGTTTTQGSSATNANLPPYITVYMWKRTA